MSSIISVKRNRESQTESPAARIRLCYLTSVLENEHSGTERHLLRLVRALDRHRFDPQLLVLQPSAFIEAWNDPQVPLRAWGYRALYRPVDWFRILQLARWLARERFQIVEFHTPETQFIGAPAAKLAKVPVLVASRRNLGYNYNWRARLQTYLTNRLIDCFLANSTLVIQRISELEGIDKRQIRLIHNGVDLACFDDEKQLPTGDGFESVWQRSMVISVAANLRPVKNLSMFLRVAKRLIDVRGNLHFALLGAGPDEADLKALANELGIQDRILFLGARVPVAPYLQRSTIGCLSSDSEGFSNAIVEYMASGLPVVATNVGGASEAVEDGSTGFLVPAGDDQAMCQRLLELIDNPALRDRMGRLGRERVEARFSLDRQMSAYESLYAQLLDEKRRVDRD